MRFTVSAATEFIASIDWLSVLYTASDVLHNGIDVGGIELDHFYVPEVFYSPDKKAREQAFELELATARLGEGTETAEPADANGLETLRRGLTIPSSRIQASRLRILSPRSRFSTVADRP